MEDVDQGKGEEDADVSEEQVREGVRRRLPEDAARKTGRHPEGGVRERHSDRVGGGQEERAAAGPPASASDVPDRHGQDGVDARGETDEDPPEKRHGVREGGTSLEVRLKGGEERSQSGVLRYIGGCRRDGLLEERKQGLRLHGAADHAPG